LQDNLQRIQGDHDVHHPDFMLLADPRLGLLHWYRFRLLQLRLLNAARAAPVRPDRIGVTSRGTHHD
jgi:hypothetical protein